MSVTLRVVLLLASVMSFLWVMRKIRKAQVALKDSVFWIASSMLLVVMGVFPDLMTWASELLGVASPVNFVYLCIIFVLLVKVFLLSINVSQLEYKLQQLVQHEAIIRMENEEHAKNTHREGDNT